MSSFRIAVPHVTGRAALAGSVVLLTLAAWAVLWLSASSETHGIFHVHHQPGAFGPGAGAAGFMVIFVVGWTVMSLAMMLPTSLPVLTVLHTFARQRADRVLLVTLAAVGYLAAWTAFGVLVGAANLALQDAIAHGRGVPGWLERASAPGLLLLAGLFQFSALKYRCLEKCRSPLGFVLSHWRGRRERWEAFRLGWASGVFCVGCCWALMLLMFLFSAGHLAWMLILGLIMAVEKNLPWGRRISAPVGLILIAAAGLLVVARPDPAALRPGVELCPATPVATEWRQGAGAEASPAEKSKPET